MQPFLAVARALSDETRVRALLALRGGELCLCQLIDVFGLAPSTVSRHMDELHRAGLVRRRKAGRWAYFRLPGRDAPLVVRRAIAFATAALAREAPAVADADRLRSVRRKDLKEVSACYRGA